MIRAAVVTVSDTRTLDNDLSGEKLVALLQEAGAEVVERIIVTDDAQGLEQTLFALVEHNKVDLIITTGGTGLAARDNTPEATRAVIEREIPGIAEAMRRETAAKTPMSMLSRGIAGTRANTLIVNLPGSRKAVEECFAVIAPVLEHSISLLRGDTDHK